MKPFDFCPSCGTDLPDAGEEGGKRCPSCGRSWYRNSAPTVGCVLVRDGRALITQRARAPHKGRYDVPGGFLHAGEDPIAGLKREIKEELGVDVDASTSDCLQMIPHEYGDEGDFVLALGFRARLVEGEPVAADDVASLRWVGKEELDEVEFAWEHDRQLVRKVLEDG